MNMPALNINDPIYSWIQIAPSVILCYVIPLNIFFIDTNFNKSNIVFRFSYYTLHSCNFSK